MKSDSQTRTGIVRCGLASLVIVLMMGSAPATIVTDDQTPLTIQPTQPEQAHPSYYPYGMFPYWSEEEAWPYRWPTLNQNFGLGFGRTSALTELCRINHEHVTFERTRHRPEHHDRTRIVGCPFSREK